MRYGIAVILIIFFAIVAIIFFSRGSGTSTPSKNATSRFTKLADYADKESSVSWTLQGRIVGEDQFKSIRITVTPHVRTIELLDGYNQSVERKTDYSNTASAYQTFTRALDLANFGRERSVKLADERGVCPLGNRFIYRLQEGSREVMRTWSDNCLTADGPFAGNANVISQIFKNQITDYYKFTSNVQLQ